MIDIHTHMLPDVDDGAEDMYDALRMAERSVESGVAAVIVTPHSNIEGVYENVHDAAYIKRYLEFCHEVKKRELPLQILPGMEIFLTEDVLPKIRAGSLVSLNMSGYYLVEFSFRRSMAWMTERLYELRSAGINLVVAHPERYEAIQEDPRRALEWVDMGCQLQMNRGSLFGKFGRGAFHAGDALLRNDMLTYIASDAHGPEERTPYLRDIYTLLENEFSKRTADLLLRENQERYLLPSGGMIS